MPAAQSIPVTYKTAGVDIDKGNLFVDILKPLVKTTYTKNVFSPIGGFSGLFKIDRMKEPLLAATTDGVGTKLKLALDYGWLDGIGIDLVGMILNDLIPCGARPLFMLDYYATGKLDLKQATTVLRGIVKGCRQCHTALIGGETAEMPGLYKSDDFDIAGFGVGIVEKRALIDGRHVKKGDLVIGLPSSGFHSNGYSLVRKVCELKRLNLKKPVRGLPRHLPLGRLLLEPTVLYVDFVLSLIDNGLPIKGMAHNTGGGVTDNLPRAFSSTWTAVVKRQAFMQNPVIEFIARLAKLSFAEKVWTFNSGIGYFMIIAERDLPRFRRLASQKKQAFEVIGHVEKRKPRQAGVVFDATPQ